MKTAEKVLAILFGLGILVKMMKMPGAGALLTLSAMPAILMYVLLGFALFNDIRLRNIFKKSFYNIVSGGQIIEAVIAGLFLAFGVQGLLFRVQRWVGSRAAFFIGCFFVTIALIYFLVRKFYSPKKIYENILYRAVAIFICYFLIAVVIPHWI